MTPRPGVGGLCLLKSGFPLNPEARVDRDCVSSKEPA
jgi:hypothetical protein